MIALEFTASARADAIERGEFRAISRADSGVVGEFRTSQTSLANDSFARIEHQTAQGSDIVARLEKSTSFLTDTSSRIETSPGSVSRAAFAPLEFRGGVTSDVRDPTESLRSSRVDSSIRLEDATSFVRDGLVPSEFTGAHQNVTPASVWIESLDVVWGAPPTLSLVITPPAPFIPSTTPLGATVAMLQGVWSDGEPFVGTYVLTSNPGNVFAISGSNLIISPSGPGVGSGATLFAVSIQPVGTPAGTYAANPQGWIEFGNVSRADRLVPTESQSQNVVVNVFVRVESAMAVAFDGIVRTEMLIDVWGSPPTLSLVITPPNPFIPSTTPLGATVATLQGVWSDFSPFTGTYVLTSNPGNVFAISGSNLIINPSGPGVGSGASLFNVFIQPVGTPTGTYAANPPAWIEFFHNVVRGDTVTPLENQTQFSVRSDRILPIENTGAALVVVPARVPIESMSGTTVIANSLPRLEFVGTSTVSADSGVRLESTKILLVDGLIPTTSGLSAQSDFTVNVESTGGLVLAVSHSALRTEVLVAARRDLFARLENASLLFKDAPILLSSEWQVINDSQTQIENTGAVRVVNISHLNEEWLRAALNRSSARTENAATDQRSSLVNTEFVGVAMQADTDVVFEVQGAAGLASLSHAWIEWVRAGQSRTRVLAEGIASQSVDADAQTESSIVAEPADAPIVLESAGTIELISPSLGLAEWLSIDAASTLGPVESAVDMSRTTTPYLEFVLGTVTLSSDSWALIESLVSPALPEIAAGRLLATPGKVRTLAAPASIHPERG